jgi:PAS domain S-box-containing protein
MKKGKTKAGQAQALRDRAEALLGGKQKDIARLSAEEIRKLVHELQVHQIELEMQNEELRMAQLDLEEARHRYYDLYDFAPVGYLTLDAKGLIEEINLAGAELLGAERSSLKKKALSRFIAPDFQDTYYLHRKGVLESRNKQTCELKLLSKKGRPRYVQVESIAAGDDEESPNQIRTVISDITQRRRAEELLQEAHGVLEQRVEERTADLTKSNKELKDEILERKRAEEATRESEKRYSSVVENSLTGIAIEQEGKIVFANTKFAEIYGFTPEEVVGMESRTLVHSEDRALVDSLNVKQYGREEAFSEYEIRGLRKTGEVIWAKTRSAVMNFGSRPALLINVVDSTKRREMEETLVASSRELQALASMLLTAQENERKRIALELHDSTVATLAAIKFRLERILISNGEEGKQAKKPLEEIATALSTAINEVRRTMINLRPSILDDLGILATINWFCREFEKTYLTMEVEKKIEIEEHEVPDPLRIVIFRVLQEAMNNAGKHSKADRLTVSLRKVDGDLKLSVEDNGRGFDVSQGTVSSEERRGLGMYSMRERVRVSGGILFVESGNGKGTSIRASWPI